MSLFETFKRGLAKTRAGLVDEIVSLVKNNYEIDDDFLDQVEEILISADIGVETSLDVIEKLRDTVNRVGFNHTDDLIGFLKDQIGEHLATSSDNRQAEEFFNPVVKPFVVMVVGVNGSGKTTTIAKLARVFRDQGNKVLLAAADTFRAAASEQLQVWADRARVDIVRTQQGGDPAAVAFDASQAALAREVDVLIVDTAGRLHTKVNLMEELKKIHRVLDKAIAGSPHEVLLVLDASTGQNAIIQAKQFKDAVGVTGVVVTKLDGTAKGGMILAVQNELDLPVKFVGLGESMDDLKPFDAHTFVEALFE
ncbi:MAG: signal recognition particle-docking protein FtsY [bacterium]